MTETDDAPGHVEAVLVALAILAPTFMIAIVVGPRKPVVHAGLALYLAVVVVGFVVTGLLDSL